MTNDDRYTEERPKVRPHAHNALQSVGSTTSILTVAVIGQPAYLSRWEFLLLALPLSHDTDTGSGGRHAHKEAGYAHRQDRGGNGREQERYVNETNAHTQ